MSIKIGVVSLGCDKNRVDSEVMLSKLVQGGYELTPNPADADVIIVNTCAFLQSARQESIDTVLEMAHYKTDGRCQKLIVTGCLGQKFGTEVFDGLTEADAVVGTNDYDNICEIVAQTLQNNRNLYNSCNTGITFGERVLTTAPHVAYIKIADGCDNFCTYCLIPYIRGRFRSVPTEDIVAHAKKLVADGVVELILVAQDTTKYGKDLYGEPRLVELIRELSQIDGLKWIRLLYCYPELMDDRLIAEIASNNKVVNCVDVPLQHVNDEILKRMNRKSRNAEIRTLFDKLAQNDIQVRSTFICGFPGETEQSMEQMQDFLREYKLRNVGFFPYSREEGTKAFDLDGQVPERKKNAWVSKMYKTQHEVVAQLNQSDVGKTYACIVDELDKVEDGTFVYLGRAFYMAPEIDGVVYIYSQRELNPGEIVDVKITNALEYDLIGACE